MSRKKITWASETKTWEGTDKKIYYSDDVLQFMDIDISKIVLLRHKIGLFQFCGCDVIEEKGLLKVNISISCFSIVFVRFLK